MLNFSFIFSCSGVRPSQLVVDRKTIGRKEEFIGGFDRISQIKIRWFWVFFLDSSPFKLLLELSSHRLKAETGKNCFEIFQFLSAVLTFFSNPFFIRLLRAVSLCRLLWSNFQNNVENFSMHRKELVAITKEKSKSWNDFLDFLAYRNLHSNPQHIYTHTTTDGVKVRESWKEISPQTRLGHAPKSNGEMRWRFNTAAERNVYEKKMKADLIMQFLPLKW